MASGFDFELLPPFSDLDTFDWFCKKAFLCSRIKSRVKLLLFTFFGVSSDSFDAELDFEGMFEVEDEFCGFELE